MKKLERGPDPMARLNVRIDWKIFWKDLERPEGGQGARRPPPP